MSVASRAIVSNFFGEQGRQNHPQYLLGLSRALFPTTFLETAVYPATSIILSQKMLYFLHLPTTSAPSLMLKNTIGIAQ